MATISASSSIGVKLKFFSDYENISPHASISIQKEVEDGLSDERYVQLAGELYEKCRKYVEAKINEDIVSAKGKDKKVG